MPTPTSCPYTDAVAYLYGLINYEMTPARMATARYLHLDRMREALARAGDPHLGLRVAHIAGTKGKGSTAAILTSILRAAGRRVGLFTSPHLIDFRERIRVDDTLIPEEDVIALTEEIRAISATMQASPYGPPTFFEALTLMAFLWFARQHVDIVVLETGMGGRLDSTNVVPRPLVTAITTIALDHTVELGDTLAAIAGEKAGILKPGVPVISAPQAPEAAEAIARAAEAVGSPLRIVGCAPVQDGVMLPVRLLGAHQRINAAVAVGMAEVLAAAGEPITPEAIRQGLATVQWPGRLQVLREDPLLILDGAHDPAAVVALLAALKAHFPDRPRRYVLGFSREKDWPAMLRALAPTATEIIVTAADNPRAVPPEVAAAELPGAYTAGTIPKAIELARAHAHPGDLICITGSLFVVGEALAWWGEGR